MHPARASASSRSAPICAGARGRCLSSSATCSAPRLNAADPAGRSSTPCARSTPTRPRRSSPGVAWSRCPWPSSGPSSPIRSGPSSCSPVPTATARAASSSHGCVPRISGMVWDRVREVEIEPSLYASDFARLGEQLDELLAAGVRVFHSDVGDGHFVEPIIIGPIVLQSIAGRIHDGGALVDVHLMVEYPERYFEPFREAGADSVTFHYEAVENVGAVAAAAREQGLGVGVSLKPATPVEDVAAAAIDAGTDLVLCMSIEPGYSGQQVMPEAFERLRRGGGAMAPGAPVPGAAGVQGERGRA